jgi:hypothetical protein
MMRLLLALLLGFVALLPALSPAVAQTGFDRRGGDYANFVVRSGDPAVCAARCERDKACRAWSFSYPRTAAVQAMCFLKKEVPPRIEDKCCSSGVKGTGVIEPRTGPEEYSTDRIGGDYRTYEMAPGAAEAQCRASCEADRRCRAWTYLRPGYGSNTARCYLKERVTRPRPRPCCISGVVR